MMNRLFELFLKLAGVLLALACVFAVVTSPDASRPEGSGMPSLPGADVDPGAVLGGLVYVLLAGVGAVAWRLRGPTRPEERLPGRQRALPPAPRGPDA